MVASVETVIGVREVLLKHLSLKMARKIVKELREVPGNASFTQTIAMLERSLKVPGWWKEE